MSDDLVARLRWSAGDSYEQTETIDDPFLLGHIHGLCDGLREAADRIEALEAVVERLTPKHRQLSSWDGSTCMGGGFAGCKQPGVTWFDNSIDPLWLCAYHAADQ